MRQCGVEPGSRDARDLADLVALAGERGHPKAVYRSGFIAGRNGDSVEIEGIRFNSRTLAHNLKDVERVFAFVATCGAELDECFTVHDDMVQSFWWELIKGQVRAAAEKHLLNHLHRTFRLEKTATMRPGSGDVHIWPIEQQHALFALLGDVRGAIGVTLTESSLMLPNKSTSGLLFPTEKSFRGCEVCHRPKCPSRQAPFNPELWAEIQHD